MQKNRSFGTGTRLTALFLLLLILIGSAAAAESGTFDLSHFRENDNLFTIDVNKDSGVAFIETALSSELRSFQHEYESDSYYSCTKFDILARDYFKSSPYPVYRLWIEYTGTKFNYTTSITFHVDSTDFTFSDVSNADRILELSNGDASEDRLIIFDGDNLSFLAALENNLTSVMEDENWMKNGVPEEKRARMTLHGIKDIEVTLDDGFYFDFLLFKGGMFNGGGYSSLFDTSGAPMEETASPQSTDTDTDLNQDPDSVHLCVRALFLFARPTLPGPQWRTGQGAFFCV